MIGTCEVVMLPVEVMLLLGGMLVVVSVTVVLWRDGVRSGICMGALLTGSDEARK